MYTPFWDCITTQRESQFDPTAGKCSSSSVYSVALMALSHCCAILSYIRNCDGGSIHSAVVFGWKIVSFDVVPWSHVVSRGVHILQGICDRISKKMPTSSKGKTDFSWWNWHECEPRRFHGLAPKGKKARVESKKQERYQSRLDIWGAISYNKPLALDIQDSEDRKQKGVRGYGKKDVKMFLRKKVAPQVAKMKEHVIVSMDRGFHFTPDENRRGIKERWSAEHWRCLDLSSERRKTMWSFR